MSSSSQFYGAISSSGGWDCDVSMDDAEHVIWQASQSGSEALNRMLSDATRSRPKKASRHSLPMAWSPPSGSNSSEASTSSTSPSDSSVPKARKAQRRRNTTTQADSFAHTYGQGSRPLTASRSVPPTFTSNPSALLSLIKEVSQKVDEETDAKHRAIERTRAKARRKEREREKLMMGKIRDNRTHGRESMDGPRDRLREQGSADLDQPQIMPKDKEMPMDVDKDAQRMPPPPNLPVHRLRSDSSTSTSTRLSLSEAQVKKPPEKISTFSVNSDTSSAINRASTSRPSKTETKAVLSIPKVSYNVPLLISTDQTAAAPITLTQPSIESSPPPPTFPSVQRMAVLPSQPKAKPRAPVLGMRRAPSNSQSSSQGTKTTLPIKQKQFKTPFARLPQSRTSTSSYSGSGSTSYSPLSSSTKVDPDSRAGSADAAMKRPARTNIEMENLSGSTTVSCGPAQRLSPTRKVKPESGRSSSPAAEADDSFTSADFDMGIDADELEKACSVYD